MKFKKLRVIALTLSYITISCATQSSSFQPEPDSLLLLNSEQISWANSPENSKIITERLQDYSDEAGFKLRGLAVRQKLAALDLDKADAWWRREKIPDPHKYLLPIILARLSLQNDPAGKSYNPQHSWDVLLKLDQEKQDLYHFRSPLDVRIFFLFRKQFPFGVETAYRRQLQKPDVLQWTEGGTENHMFMQRASGLALMNGSGLPVGDPASAATNDAWLRSELNKFLTIGQGEFHSSIYYGYSISGLLNLYDFAENPKLQELAQQLLDWFAANMALRLSWGTAGGAESRGFDRGTWDSGLTAVAWLWWGDKDLKPLEKMQNQYVRLALPAALSSYRPPEKLRAIARKEISLPFEARMSHPAYYSYDASNSLWENFYITNDYSLGTLIEPARSYQVEGTIRAQYATYKLVARDPKGQQNAVMSLGGTYHGVQATGRSPGDQYVQKRGAVIFQLILNETDLKAGVPPRSHFVLPSRYGKPQRYKNWYIWQVENIWVCARPWGDEIEEIQSLNKPYQDYQALAAKGTKTAWITDVASVQDYRTFQQLKKALDQTQIQDQSWQTDGKLSYKSLAGDEISMIYEQNGSVGEATINGEKRHLENWPVIESPYIQVPLNEGILKMID